MPSLVELGQVVLERKMKMLKVYDNIDGQWTNFDQKSSLEPSALVSYKLVIFIHWNVVTWLKDCRYGFELYKSINQWGK